MKKLLILAFVTIGGLGFTGCQKDETAVDLSTETAADLTSVENAAARYALLADSVTTQKCKGKLTEVATSELAASITSYITASYAGAEIKFAAKDEAGRVVVAIVLADGTAKGLLFNADGTFKEELKDHGRKAKLTEVEVSSLPASITDYVAANYAGAEIKKAGTNTDGEYFVGILADGTMKVLLFNADGTFNKELEKPAKGHGKKRK
ncbi:hypothetical protein [Dyadobacter helix]|nr:hypothetical protein [Dyadobacter sp. CECT 9275]